MSKFQQRHYEAVAGLMQEAWDWAENHNGESAIMGMQHLEDKMVELFRSDNGLFQGERFKRACVPGANVRARS